MHELIPFVLFAFSTAFTPGPNNILLMNSGMYFGLKKSMRHCLGVCVGFPLMVLIVSLGVGAIFEEYAWIKSMLKIIGSLYMLYLAWKILRISHVDKARPQKPWHFWQAVLFQWVNPKAWLMAVGTISIFTLSDDYIFNILLISFIYFLIGIFSSGAWLVFGNYLQRFLNKPHYLQAFNWLMAISLVASIVMIFD